MPPSHDSIRRLTRSIRAFAEARDWEQFHTPKKLVMALSVEVAELAEHFQWLTPEEAKALGRDEEVREELASEVADLAIFLLRLADLLDVDVGEAVRRKLERNEARFPVDRELCTPAPERRCGRRSTVRSTTLCGRTGGLACRTPAKHGAERPASLPSSAYTPKDAPAFDYSPAEGRGLTTLGSCLNQKTGA